MSNLTPRDAYDPQPELISGSLRRQTHRQLDYLHAQSTVQQAAISARAKHAAHVIQARNAIAAAAAKADAQLANILAALPVHDELDADFKRQLQAVTRANVVADLYGFEP